MLTYPEVVVSEKGFVTSRCYLGKRVFADPGLDYYVVAQGKIPIE